MHYIARFKFLLNRSNYSFKKILITGGIRLNGNVEAGTIKYNRSKL